MPGIDLSRSPYFDDFDANDNYYQVLFRPSVAVQTRELNQVQSILQDQIAKFGRNIFKDGSVTEGCSFTFDKNYTFVKIDDNYSNGTAFIITDFQDMWVTNINGLQAVIVNTFPGYQTQDPDTNTLYIKYLNSAAYTNGVQQSVFDPSEDLQVTTPDGIYIGNVSAFTPNTLDPNSVVTGKGYSFHTSDGVVYKNGYFVNVRAQSIVVNKYDNYPDNISVGFSSIENIVTPESNTSLYDNALGSPNYSAPGAHRYQIIPTLVTMQTDIITNTNPFFSLCDFQSGVPISIKNDPQYNIIGNEMARRSYETNGDYVVNPFVLTTEAKYPGDLLYSSYNNLICSRGLAYVKGFRTEFLNNITIPIRKATNFQSSCTSITTVTFGNYININQYCGDFRNCNLVQVELHNVAKTSVSSRSFLGVSYSTATRIGYAYLRGFSYSYGNIGTGDDIYTAYIFDIQMNAGQTFDNVQSIIYYSGSVKAVADLILTYDPTTNTNIAEISQSSYNMMIFPTGQKGTKLDGFNNQSYVYRKTANSSFSNLVTGSTSITIGPSLGSATETFDFGGYLSGIAETNFIVTPIGAGTSSNKTGTVGVSSGNNTVIGSATSFLTEYFAGDWITINSQTHQINSITSQTSLTLKTLYGSPSAVANVHCKTFPAGIPIDFTKGSRSIVIAANTCTFSLNEHLDSSFNSSIYFDVLRKQTQSIKKQIQRGIYVAINCASHPAGFTGPWSLGLVDVIGINAVYINEGLFSNTNAVDVTLFNVDTGQRDDHYEQSMLYPVSSNYGSNTRILIELNAFIYDMSQGVGYFTANSYPVDDINLANTSSMATIAIPQYTSVDGSTFDLRDCIDFRPFANNDANTSANSLNWNSSATINPNGNANLVFYVNPTYGSFIPAPDANYITDLQFYLPRKDKVVLTTGGKLSVIEGIPSNRPAAPIDLPNAMTLGIMDVPPYPTLATPDARGWNRYDYAIAITVTQNKRYTMKDVNAISNKVTQLEYYTSLNLLEQSAQNMLVKSSTTGQNRFQNGILVDPFAGADIADTLDPSYNICIDQANTELRPAITIYTKAVWTDNDDLPFDESQYIFQGHTSMTVNCIVGTVTHRGRIDFHPSCQPVAPTYYQTPDVCNDFAMNSCYINKPVCPPCMLPPPPPPPPPGPPPPLVVSSISYAPSSILANEGQFMQLKQAAISAAAQGADSIAFGMDWGSWKQYDGTLQTTQDIINSGWTDTYGNPVQQYQSKTVSPDSSLNIGINTVSKIGQFVGSPVVDTSVIDYTKARDIPFVARGLKPNTQLNMFVGGYNVTFYTRQCDKGFSEPSVSGFGQNITSDENGCVYGLHRIPSGIMKQGTQQFTLCDTTDICAAPEQITTRCDGHIRTNFTDINHWSCDLDDQNAWDEADIHSDYASDTQPAPFPIQDTVVTCPPAVCIQPPFPGCQHEYDCLSVDRRPKIDNYCNSRGIPSPFKCPSLPPPPPCPPPPPLTGDPLLDDPTINAFEATKRAKLAVGSWTPAYPVQNGFRDIRQIEDVPCGIGVVNPFTSFGK